MIKLMRKVHGILHTHGLEITEDDSVSNYAHDILLGCW